MAWRNDFKTKYRKLRGRGALKGIDPSSEYGEYHSIVTELKSLGKGLKSTSTVKDEGACTSCLLLMNPQIVKTNDK